jgi:hypothetical protein
MIREGQIGELVNLLKSRRASLYHACQLADFRSYLAVGGVPSRACLEGGKQQFTAFETDGTDHSNGVWDKVFVNLSDFGVTFANGGKGVPNPYGPISLKIRPEALLEATDAAICLRSAGAAGFNRNTEALKTVEEVDWLFEHPPSVGLPKSAFIKFRAKLREKYPEAADPEVSCTVPSGRLFMRHVERAIVDPYTFPKETLLDLVNKAKQQHNGQFAVYSRSCPGAGRADLYNELAALLMDGVPSLSTICGNPQMSDSLRQWCQTIIDSNLAYQYRRYAKYLREGTLAPALGFAPSTTRECPAPGPSDESEIPF